MVEHRYLAAIISVTEFSPVFRDWITATYTDIYSVEPVNGFLSEPFATHRSGRQGCPLTSLLHFMVLEPLLLKLEAGQGIPRDLGFETTVTAYTDDVKVLVPDVEHL
ncbi:hypothetical protein Ahia01_000222300, partial [Argonauta hians]